MSLSYIIDFVPDLFQCFGQWISITSYVSLLNVSKKMKPLLVATKCVADILDDITFPNFDYDCTVEEEIRERFCIEAAKSGHLELLKWFASKRSGCHRSSISMISAYNGHVHILEWLDQLKIRIDPYAFSGAAFRGSIDAMKWLLKKNYFGDKKTSEAYSRAVAGGSVEAMNWLHKHSFSEEISPFDVESAALKGYVNVIEKIGLDVCKEMNIDLCGCAANGNQNDFLSSLIGKGYPLFASSAVKAISGHNLCGLKMIVNSPFFTSRGDETCYAASFGYTAILDYLKSKKFPLRQNDLANAIAFERVQAVKWLLDNDCPLPSEEDRRTNNPEILSLLSGK